jgi:hypothetical protein
MYRWEVGQLIYLHSNQQPLHYDGMYIHAITNKGSVGAA